MAKQLTLKSLKNDLAFVESQIAASSDPTDTIQLMWEQRREALKREIAATEEQQDTHAHVALLFNGAPVVTSKEIKLDFATKVLENYQAIVSTLAAAKAGTELGARGRLPSSFASKLFIRDMVRGSVGFLIEEQEPTQRELIPSLLKEAVDEATTVLADLSSNDQHRFEDRMQELSPRTIGALKKLAKVLHDSGAETRIVDDEKELNLNYSDTASLHARLNEVEYTERTEKRRGVLLGLFPERKQYEFRSDEGALFYGPVSDEFDAKFVSEPEFARAVLMQPSEVTFIVSSVFRASLLQREERTLQNIIR